MAFVSPVRKYRRLAVSMMIVLALWGVSLLHQSTSIQGSPGPELVSIVQSSTYPVSDAALESMVREAVAKAGGLEGVISPGDFVVIKPNMVETMWTSGSGVVTDRRVVRTVVRMAQEAGAGRVVIAEGTAGYRDNERSDRFSTEKAFQDCGLDTNGDMIDDETGVELFDLNIAGPALDTPRPEYVTLVNLGDGLLQRAFYVPNILLECDVLISVPTLKNHHTGTITGSLKNRVGCAPADLYHYPGWISGKHGLVHFSSFWDDKVTVNRAIIDLNRVRPSDFTVTDGLVGITNGPCGYNKPSPYVRCILAGRDATAVDIIHSLIIGYSPNSVLHLVYARDIGFGQTNPALITVAGKSVSEVRNLFPDAYGGAVRVELISPSIGGISPPTGSTVSGIVNVLTNNVTDNSGVIKAELYVNGILYATDITAPYSFEWDTADYAPGPHTLKVKVYDAALNEASRTHTVTVVASTGQISGYVLDAGGGPISGAAVSTSPGGYSATSGTNGYYSISGVAPGDYEVTAGISGYYPQMKSGIGVTVGQTTLCDFSLQQETLPFSGLLNGDFEGGFYNSPDTDHQVGNHWTRFVLSGAPKHMGWYGVAHSPNWSQSFYEASWTGGVYQRCLNAVPGFKYTAGVWASGFVDAGGHSGSTDLRFQLGVDPSGGTNPASSGVQWSDEAAPGGVWTQITKQVTALATSITVFLKASNSSGENRYAAFDDAYVIEDGPGGGTISGMVRNSIGIPLSGATVTSDPGGYSVQTNPTGGYVLTGVPVGVYSVTASRSGYTSQTSSGVSVTANETANVVFTLADPTPPATPVVTDTGDTTSDLTRLSASWTSSDPQTGVAEYRYAVRTAGGNYVVGWTSAGTDTSVTCIIELTPGERYFFEVEAKNGEGLWSARGVSDGITAVLVANTIASAKAMADGGSANITGIVTAGFPVAGSQQRIYVQNADRSCGIAVSTTTEVLMGDEVTVSGTMATQDGERILNAGSVAVSDQGLGVPKPIAVTNRGLGGGSFGLQSAVVNNASTGSLAEGLNNVGLLVAVNGSVTCLDPAGVFFYVDDGSGIRDGSGCIGVRVACSDLPKPSSGQYVFLRGISSTTVIGGRIARLLRPRTPNDLSYAGGLNYVSNPGFETGNLSGWTTYGSVGGPHSGTWFAGVKAHSGNWFVGNAADGGTTSGGLYQRIPVPHGLVCYASVWSCLYRGNNSQSAVQNRVGIDPTGGLDRSSPSVIWSDVHTQPVAWTHDWRQLITAPVTSTGGYVTIYLDMQQYESVSWHINAFDDARVFPVTP